MQADLSRTAMEDGAVSLSDQSVAFAPLAERFACIGAGQAVPWLGQATST